MDWIAKAANRARLMPMTDTTEQGWLGRYGPLIKAGALALIPIATAFLSHAIFIMPVHIQTAPASKKPATHKTQRLRPQPRSRLRPRRRYRLVPVGSS